MMNALEFIEELSRVSLKSVFNPYRDRCDIYDVPNAPAIRRTNLCRYLDAVKAGGIRSVWLGRDCGYRGGRRTGIALTDEFQLESLQRRFDISGIGRATLGTAVKERTASEVWKVIGETNANVFLWNVFPFHPFEDGQPLSNRAHKTSEYRLCKGLLLKLLDWLQPQSIVTLGADAYKAITDLGYSATKVRHPSYGGHKEFRSAIHVLYPQPKELRSSIPRARTQLAFT